MPASARTKMENTMSRKTTIVTIVIAAVLGASVAAADIRILEQAIETNSAAATLPDKSSGSIVVTACSTCSPVLLRLTPLSKYRVGRTEVTFDEFRALARDNGTRNLGVFYDAKKRTITRLVLSGDLPRRAR